MPDKPSIFRWYTCVTEECANRNQVVRVAGHLSGLPSGLMIAFPALSCAGCGVEPKICPAEPIKEPS